MDRLIAAYLYYRANDTGDGMPVSVDPPTRSQEDMGPATMEIELIDIFSASCVVYLIMPCES